MKTIQILKLISSITGKPIRQKFGMSSCGEFYVHKHSNGTIELLVWLDGDNCIESSRRVWTAEQVVAFVKEYEAQVSHA